MKHWFGNLPRLGGKLGQFVGLFSLCLMLVVACQSGDRVSPPNGTVNSDRLTVGTTLKPRTLDPADSYELSGLNLIYNLSDRLYTYELGTTELKPQLATQMPEISPDNLTYTIPLRDDVIFHDGTPFNGEAMAFSLRRFMKNGGKPSFLLTDIVESIETTGEYEITIQLKRPFAAFTSLLAFTGACAVSPAAYEIGSFNPNQFVGTGPYKLVKYNSDSVRLDVFDQYWGEKPRNQGVDMQIYSGNSANLFNSFRTGAIDLAYQSLDPEQVKNLQAGAKEQKWQVLEASGTAINYLVLNRNQKPLDNPKIRQAIAALIDRNLINQRVLQGQAEPVYSLIPSAFAAYQPTFADTYGDGNVAKAKQLLTEAGYSATNPAVVEIWYPSNSTTRALVATTLKAFAEQKLDGLIRFELQSVEGATAFSNLGKGIYQTFLSNWYPDFLDADNYIQPLLDCDRGSQAQGCQEGSAQSQGSFYYSQRMNQLIDQQRQTKDLATRKAIFAEIQELLAKDVPYIPLWQTKDYIFAQNSIRGVRLNPSQNIAFREIEQQ